MLRKIDKQFRRINSVLKLAPMPYDIVVLSDHGQTQGSTFLQRYGKTLEELVSDLTQKAVSSGGQGDESASSLNTSLTEISEGEGLISKTVKKLRPRKNLKSNGVDKNSELIVMASGCLGLIYFNKIKGRVSYEQIEKLYPGLVQALTRHSGIGFILLHSKKDGPIVLGKHGKYFLKTGKISGSNPLQEYGLNAAQHVKRTSGFSNCADIMINSTFWSTPGEVAAFEELVGSHGGLGGTQNYPFVLYPSKWPRPKNPIVGAEALHKQLVEWIY